MLNVIAVDLPNGLEKQKENGSVKRVGNLIVPRNFGGRYAAKGMLCGLYRNHQKRRRGSARNAQKLAAHSGDINRDVAATATGTVMG